MALGELCVCVDYLSAQPTFEKSSAKTFLDRSLQDVHSARPHCLVGLYVCVALDFIRHPERSEAESNFFVLDPKRHCVPFAPHCVRSSTALRMTQTKKCRAKRGRIYEQLAHNVRTNPAEKFSSTFFKRWWVLRATP